MFGLSGGHLLILAVVVLLMGRNRLPELGSALGKGMHAFKKGISGEGLEDKTQTEKTLAQKQNTGFDSHQS